MAHVQKFTREACGHMFLHYSREASNISNPNLDRERSSLNVNLATHQHLDQYDFMVNRIAEVRCQKRKDVNVMCDWVVTAPKDLPVERQSDFFEASYQFLEDKYGKENVISCWVHYDEVQPHMHFSFIPITVDKKKGGYKVSAKEVLTRSDLKDFHSDLQEYVSISLRKKVSVLNEATKDGNKSIKQLKQETVEAAHQEAAEIVAAAKEEVKAAKSELISLNQIIDVKKDNLSHFDNSSYSELPAGVRVSKNPLKREKEYIMNEKTFDNLRITKSQYEALESSYDKLNDKVMSYSSSIQALKKQNRQLEAQVFHLTEENNRITKNHNMFVEALDKALNFLGIDVNKVYDILEKFKKQLNKNKSKSKKIFR